MTLHIPKQVLWLLAALGVGGAVIGAFLIGRSSNADSSSEEKVLACTEEAAKKAMLQTPFVEEVNEAGNLAAAMEGTELPAPARPFFHDRRGFRVEFLECADLGSSPEREMIVGLGGGAGGRIFHWAVFKSGRGAWRLAFSRHGVPTERLVVRDEVLIELTPAYEEGDPLCCPSGKRAASFDFVGSDFRTTLPRSSAAERLVEADSAGISRIGSLDARSASPVDAQLAFGRPSWTLHEGGEVCTMAWSNIGVEIFFANLGGQDPCGPEGAIGSFEVGGAAAAQAGWETSEGARLGMSTAELLRLYPTASFDSDQLILLSVPTPFGDSGVTPALSAFMFQGKAAGFRGYVGAAGE